MKKLMGLFLTAALLTGLLAGCAGTSAENSNTSTPESIPSTTETSTPELSESDEAAWPRTIGDNNGNTITLEKQPERVAVIYFGDIDILLALGYPPIASCDIETAKEFSSLVPFADELDDMIDLGSRYEPNLEKILSAEPDLIIASNIDLYDELSKIAPTVAFEGVGNADWRNGLNKYSECLGLEAEAEAYIAEFEGIIADAREKFSVLEEETFVVLSANGKGTFWESLLTYNPFYFSDEIGLGFTPAEGHGLGEGGQITIETLALYAPDHIILYWNDSPDFLDQESSVWQSLKAVKAGQVYSLDYSAMTGAPMALELAVETLVESIAVE